MDERLAFTAISTTGLKPVEGGPNWWPHLRPWHEICAISVIVARQTDLEIIGRFDARVRIEHPDRADEKSLRINGYTPGRWRNAKDLMAVLKEYNQVAGGAVLTAHNATLVWEFLRNAFVVNGIEPALDHRRLDLWSYAVAVLQMRRYKLEPPNLNGLAKFLGLEELRIPHSALDVVNLSHQVHKALQTLEPARITGPYQVNPFEGNLPHLVVP